MTFDWWTFGLQTVNVLILVWLLGRFFWRPVAAMIEQRRRDAQSLLAQAQADRETAARALAEAERRLDGFARERDQHMAQARQDVAETRRVLMAQAEAEASALREQAKAAIAAERADSEAAWSARAGELATIIAGKLAARLDGPAVTDAFLQWLLREIAVLTDESRRSIAAADIEIVSAALLDAALQKRVGEALGAALGATPILVFRIDPALIAGLELRTPHFVLTNSWRADLARILSEMSHDRRQ